MNKKSNKYMKSDLNNRNVYRKIYKFGNIRTINTRFLSLTLHSSQSEIIRLTMSFVAPAEHDEVACALAVLLLADAGVKVDTAMIDKVWSFTVDYYCIGPQGYQQHC